MFRILVAAFAVMMFSVSASTARERDWVKLGERHVPFVSYHDTIHVGKHDGRFVRLRLNVHRDEIKLNSVRVVFGNGETEVIPFERHVHQGESGDIPLPHGWHEGHFIHEVELHYHSQPDWSGREAEVELWGQGRRPLNRFVARLRAGLATTRDDTQCAWAIRFLRSGCIAGNLQKRPVYV